MNKEFVRVSGRDGSSIFLVWDREKERFETYSGDKMWSSWSQFVLSFNAAEGIEEGEDEDHYYPTDDDIDDDRVPTSHIEQWRWERLQRYERVAPSAFKGIVHQSLPNSSKRWSNFWIYFWTLAGLVFIGALIWDVAKPVLGELGLVEYKPPVDKRYESFLTKVAECQEKKKVFSRVSSTVPVFQTFACPDGTEQVWAYRVDVAKKSHDGKWTLE